MGIEKLIRSVGAAKELAVIIFLVATISVAVLFGLNKNWEMFSILLGIALVEVVVYEVKKGISPFGFLID